MTKRYAIVVDGQQLSMLRGAVLHLMQEDEPFEDICDEKTIREMTHLGEYPMPEPEDFEELSESIGVVPELSDLVEAAVKNCLKLPPECVVISPLGDVVRVKRGATGCFHVTLEVRERVNQIGCVAVNAESGISPQVASAMLNGSLFGFHTPAADPDRYNELGEML